MAKYVHLSRVYLSDEEFYELLSPKNVGKRELLKLARLRGHIFSEKANDADVRSRLSMLPSDWSTVYDILQSIAKPDPEERKSSRIIHNCAPDNDIEQIAQKVQTTRNKNHEEVYTFVKTGENTARIDVKYTEVDCSRAVPYQRRERALSVEITKSGETVHFLHNANDRAGMIVEAFKALLAIKAEAQIREEQITLTGIRDAVLRTKFFHQLIKGIPGYKYQNATHLTVDRRLADKTETDNGEAEEGESGAKAKKAAEIIKGLVHKVSLTGEQVLAAELYQQAASSGYFITGISWSCVDEKDTRFYIECEAGFADPVAADKFGFDVTRKWQLNPDARNGQELVPLTMAERRNLNDLLEKSALNSSKLITEEYQKNKGKSLTDKPSSLSSP